MMVSGLTFFFLKHADSFIRVPVETVNMKSSIIKMHLPLVTHESCPPYQTSEHAERLPCDRHQSIFGEGRPYVHSTSMIGARLMTSGHVDPRGAVDPDDVHAMWMMSMHI